MGWPFNSDFRCWMRRWRMVRRGGAGMSALDRRRKYDWHTMAVGDERSFEARSTVRVAAHLYAKRHGWKLITRKDGDVIIVKRAA